MGRQSQHCLEHTIAIIMRCLVLVGSVLACVSSAQSTFDTGYGVPAAPVLVTRVSPLPSPIPQPILPASLPLTQPLPFSLPPQPFLVPSAAPLAQPLPIQQPFLAPAPLAQPLPFAPIAPVAPIVEPPSSQFHAQDEFGQFSFGYQNINSARSESKDAFGVTRGSYQYVDANNVVQTVHYTADDINGFRVAATNVPVAPAAALLVCPWLPRFPCPPPWLLPSPSWRLLKWPLPELNISPLTRPPRRRLLRLLRCLREKGARLSLLRPAMESPLLPSSECLQSWSSPPWFQLQ